ncbi:hypothetical protein PUN28_014249 [Cardiocondyla obscurior]
MRILKVLGFFSILFINSDQFNVFPSFVDSESIQKVKATCNFMESISQLLNLKRNLFCDYDNNATPNPSKTTNVSLSLMPKILDFDEENGDISLHSWIALNWMDPQLIWTPSDYEEITFVHVKSWQIWSPNLYADTIADISDRNRLPTTECLLYNSGLVSCVFAVKFISKCNPDFTYWPYDKHQCRVTFFSWKETTGQVNLQIDGTGIFMNDYINDTMWDFKFINSTKRVINSTSNETSPWITYDFLLTRHHGKMNASTIVPAIALMMLTLVVLCLDLKSIERVMVACVNFICHLLSMYVVQLHLPYNGANTPHILLFYRESLGLATFALILTALLRKVEDMTTDIPSWISLATTFVLNNKAGRFLILKDDDLKTTDRDNVNEENTNAPKSSWKYFSTIIDWLSFFCIVLTYAIVLIILLPVS